MRGKMDGACSTHQCEENFDHLVEEATRKRDVYGSVILNTPWRHMGGGGIGPPFLTSALGGGEWWASRTGLFTPGERAPESKWTPGPVWTLWSRDKSLASAGNRTPAVQHIARRYTDWAILAPWEYNTNTNIEKCSVELWAAFNHLRV
jgi:hypothetical protein